MGAVMPETATPADRRAAAQAALRGMNIVALYSPFIVGFAVAYTYLPAVPVWQIFTLGGGLAVCGLAIALLMFARSEEHTSELQSLMRISYAVFCLKKKTPNKTKTH